MAASGSSNEPGTQCVSMRSGATPPDSSAATAPWASVFEIGSLKRAATTAKRPADLPPEVVPAGARPAMSVGQRGEQVAQLLSLDRKSTRLNSSHLGISYAV